METAIGKITAFDDRIATVVVDSAVACKRCAAGKGCGAGIFQDGSHKREIRLEIPAGMSLREGDTIELVIGPKFLLRAAMLAYGLPLSCMVLFPALVSMVAGNPGDGPGIALAVTGLGVGLLVGRRILNRASICDQFVPSIGTSDDRIGSSAD